MTSLATETTQSAASWQINPAVRRRTSPNAVSLVFIPGQNVVLELNPIATAILEAFSEPQSFKSLCERLQGEYEVDDAAALETDVTLLLERFVKHGVVLATSGREP